MIRLVLGDLLNQQGVLCHQVNYEGVMGAGVAAAICNRLLSADQYREYQQICRKQGESLLGTNLYMPLPDGRVVANCFCQNSFMRLDNGGSITNYDAMRKCFCDVRGYAIDSNLPVCIPRGMGCGIAGGSWEKVRDIIGDVFGEDSEDVDVWIVQLGDAG